MRTHDGFFARLGTGFAPWSETLRPKEKSEAEGPLRIDTTGIATVSDLTVGWSISRHWVLGLSLQFANLEASTSRQSKDTTRALPEELDPGARAMGLLGVSALWFSNPKGGFNMGGGLALGGVRVPQVKKESSFSVDDRYVAAGLALNLEIGHTFWVAEQWSVGLRGRLNAAFFAGKDDADVEWHHNVLVSPGAVFDIVYH